MQTADLTVVRMNSVSFTAVKVGVPKLGNCLEMYTCAQACAQAFIQLQCKRGGQAVAPVYKECPSLYTPCAQI